MNKERKQRVRDVVVRFKMHKDSLESILFDEQWAYDNMPENFQTSLRGLNSEEAIDTLENVIKKLDEMISGLEDIM